MKFCGALAFFALFGVALALPHISFLDQEITEENLRHLLFHLSRINKKTICVVRVDDPMDGKRGQVLNEVLLQQILAQVKGSINSDVIKQILKRYRCANKTCRHICLATAAFDLKTHWSEDEDDYESAEEFAEKTEGPAKMTKRHAEQTETTEEKEWKPLQDTPLGRNYPANLKTIIKNYARYFEESRTRHGHRLSQQALKLDEESEEFKKVCCNTLIEEVQVAHELWDRVIGGLRFQFSRAMYPEAYDDRDD